MIGCSVFKTLLHENKTISMYNFLAAGLLENLRPLINNSQNGNTARTGFLVKADIKSKGSSDLNQQTKDSSSTLSSISVKSDLEMNEDASVLANMAGSDLRAANEDMIVESKEEIDKANDNSDKRDVQGFNLSSDVVLQILLFYIIFIFYLPN